MAATKTDVSVGVLLFDGYEPLDVVGPISVFGSVPGIRMVYISERAGNVTSQTGTMTMVTSHSFADAWPPAAADGGESSSREGTEGAPQQQQPGGGLKLDWLLVPGGIGTRQGVNSAPMLEFLQAWAAPESGLQLCMSVCTGAALLAAAGLLDGRRATSNKIVFDSWVTGLRPQVTWVKKARWVWDGMFVTSSGVTAGADMAVAVVKAQLGPQVAAAAAARLEYVPHTDPDDDPFANSSYEPPV